MGLYDTVKIEGGVELPAFPSELDATKLAWQTKSLGTPAMQTYKLTSDGRLLRLEVDHREKTCEEKAAEAAEHGFESWEEYVAAVEDASIEEAVDRGFPTGVPSETVQCDEWWADHNQHGSFEIHASSPTESAYDIMWSYEARFTKGELDEIVLLGERHGGGPDAVRDAVE
ncbi:hypothetical protein [Salinibaculum rarum]|uniref:hypothetical protein n=1 Tax=Salinibaculum rarum TaxID=3058903 RepID=UPI00265F4F23|nr:hypothetical protein [Salinibaculum sp. KK48]